MRNKLIQNEHFQEDFPMLRSGFRDLSVGLACAMTNQEQGSY